MGSSVRTAAAFGPSALWVADAMKKHGTNRFLLAPIDTEQHVGPMAMGLAEALASTLGKRVAVLRGRGVDDISSENAGVEIIGPADPGVSSGLEDLLADVGRRADVILYLGTPLLAGPESVIVARTIPHVIVAAQIGRTSKSQIQRVVQLARREPFTIVGSILLERHRYIPRWLDRWLE
jgi:hypothetical protein